MQKGRISMMLTFSPTLGGIETMARCRDQYRDLFDFEFHQGVY